MTTETQPNSKTTCMAAAHSTCASTTAGTRSRRRPRRAGRRSRWGLTRRRPCFRWHRCRMCCCPRVFTMLFVATMLIRCATALSPTQFPVLRHMRHFSEVVMCAFVCIYPRLFLLAVCSEILCCHHHPHSPKPEKHHQSL